MTPDQPIPARNYGTHNAQSEPMTRNIYTGSCHTQSVTGGNHTGMVLQAAILLEGYTRPESTWAKESFVISIPINQGGVIIAKEIS